MYQKGSYIFPRTQKVALLGYVNIKSCWSVCFYRANIGICFFVLIIMSNTNNYVNFYFKNPKFKI